jgi:hypothetical protein
MAYINQEKKAELAKEIAKVMPTNWKYTLKIRHHSTFVLTIRQADVYLIKENMVSQTRDKGELSYCSINEYSLHSYYSGKLLKIFESIKGAMMVGNHDNSDIQSDYFDVGWYIDINIGKYEAPFRLVPVKNDSFKPGDRVLYCGEEATVIENYGRSGTVEISGQGRMNWYWEFQGESVTLKGQQ